MALETPGPHGAEDDDRSVLDDQTPAASAPSLLRWLLETAVLVTLALLLSQGVRAYAVQPFVVPSGSMLPTIQLQDRIIAEKLTYRLTRGPAYGDVVVFDAPFGPEEFFVKRVIATEGQTVDIRDGAVWVDGKRLDEPYVHGEPTETAEGMVSFPLTVPDGEVFLLGDNRPGSGDGRIFGTQPVEHIRGRVIWTYWPPSRFGPLE